MGGVERALRREGAWREWPGRSGPRHGEQGLVGTTAQRRERGGRARTAALAAPIGAQGRLVTRIVPSQRSVGVGLALAAAAFAAYMLARDTGMFAIRRIDVAGAPPAVRLEVRAALAPLAGTSLVALDGTALEQRVDALPTVVSARYDRDFPHTLRVRVVPERAVGVLRAGRNAWLVSARARVIGALPAAADSSLPRIWLPAATRVAPGDFLAPGAGGAAALALAFARGFPARIDVASSPNGAIVLRLGSGLELRLGDVGDLRLKLAVARRALRLLPPGTTYLDVSVPGRPVAGDNTQVSAGA